MVCLILLLCSNTSKELTGPACVETLQTLQFILKIERYSSLTWIGYKNVDFKKPDLQKKVSPSIKIENTKTLGEFICPPANKSVP